MKTQFYFTFLGLFLLVISINGQTVQDIDGNVYKTVKIGEQIWMAENLKVTKYNDGTNIILGEENKTWGTLSIGGYCWYNNDLTNYKDFCGALYNWYAVNSGKLCPEGWHVPNDEEWATLISFLGGEKKAGDKMKEAGTMHWSSPNKGTNESGFSAISVGARDYDGFGALGYSGYWWSTTENENPATANIVYLTFGKSNVYQTKSSKNFGYNVRCIKD